MKEREITLTTGFPAGPGLDNQKMCGARAEKCSKHGVRQVVSMNIKHKLEIWKLYPGCYP